ncbi:hypothetical protein CLCR_00948 [Cladophialophora carrionii]|uniref:Uncharacterized protein n=1 Tax=Cladophialophora carrionii TaxID=86049 RepID=A0A1C1D1E7_9EURO|nr:hypothetical protein CLCR_00948 [Cladophialophora carrionii]
MPPKRGQGSRRSAPVAVSARTKSLDNDFAVENDQAGGDFGGEEREGGQRTKIVMAVDTRLRTGENQRRLEHAFDNQVRELEDQIDERAEEHQQDIKRVQDAFLTSLLALIRKKADLEQQIVEHVQALVGAYEVVKEEFQAVLQGRLKDVREAIDTLGGLERTGTAASEDRY